VRGKKILLIIVGLTLLLAVLLLMLRRRTEQSLNRSVTSAQDGTFLVQVERPAFSGRPIWEVPRAILGDGDRDLRFDDMTPGAKVEYVGPTGLEVSADGGWALVIVSDDQGRVLPGTHLIFTLSLPRRDPLKLNCRPADPAVGHFNATARVASDRFDGDFLLKLPACQNAVSRKNTAGLPTFTVRGGFKGLPRVTKMTDR
jgi:hypothetical protein